MPLYLVESSPSTKTRASLRERLTHVRQPATRVIEALVASDGVFTIVEARNAEDAGSLAGRLGMPPREVWPVRLVGQSLDEVAAARRENGVAYLVRALPAASNDAPEGLRFERAYRSLGDEDAFFLYDTPCAALALAAQESRGARIKRLARIEKIA